MGINNIPMNSSSLTCVQISVIEFIPDYAKGHDQSAGGSVKV
jgi:hypothetical protein